MEKVKCEELLQEVIRKKLYDENQWKNDIQIPVVIKQAWGNNTLECYESVWSYIWVESMVDKILNWDIDATKTSWQVQVQPSEKTLNETSSSSSSSQISSTNNNDEYLQEKTHWAATKEEYYEIESWYNEEYSSASSIWKTTQTVTTSKWLNKDISYYWTYALKIVWLWVLIVLLFVLIKYLLAFVYDVLNSHRMIYMKIIVPRWDTKFDRDKEKELAKDMKEKIWRMAQVYRNIHKLWELSVIDNILRFIFDKPKISFILHYEKGLLTFIIWTYPEYRKIIEWAVAAQYSDASLESIKRPNFFAKKFFEIIPMHPIKDTVYPIRTFKQLEDDPLNNVIDSVWKLSVEDTFSIIITSKPQWDAFNKRAQKFSEALYKKDEAFLKKWKRRKKILMPWTIFDFLIHGPSQWLIKTFAPWAQQWDPFIRMVKAEEEALNTMWEEAGKHAFMSWLLLATSSNEKDRCTENMHNVLSAFTVYRDEYNNELDQPEFAADLFGFILKPLWKFAASFHLPNFFYFKNIFTVNELTSLYHLPDGMFNRSPIIKRLDYKVIAAPDNIPQLKEDSWFMITWIIAEDYKKWNISDILSWVKHRAVWQKTESIEETIPYEKATKEQIQTWETIEQDWKKLIKITKEIKKNWLKVFKDWSLLWINVHRNKFTPVYMKKKDRSRHHYIIWKSGWGKSVYIASLARQDIWNWDWICVIDPHGDLVEDIMEYIPKERAKDVIYFDAGNEERPMWLNLYEIDNIDQADRVVNDATEIFLKMFGSEIFWPRIQEYFKYWSLTLLEDLEDWATLLDVPRLFTDEVFREYKIKKVKNPIVRNFWERTYNSMGDREKQEIIPYFTSKFVSFNTNRLIRNIIWQTKSAFRFRQAMDEWKILLVNLSKWKIWEINAQLLWMVLVSQIYNAAMSRANVPEDQRRDFYLYVDEFQNFVTWTFADILSEARKYHLSLIMAHQYIAQLEDKKAEWWKADVKKAVFWNVGTMQSFKVGAEDAEFLEKEYSPVLSAQDIIWISNYKVYIKLNIDNATSRVFSLDTIWTKDYQNKKVAEILKEYSSKKYWRKREFVDAEICARLGMIDDIETQEAPASDQIPDSSTQNEE